MILVDVRQYLSTRGPVPIADLCHRFNVEADAVRAILAVWMRKGRVRRVEGDPACGGCCRCGASPDETYEWVGNG